MKHMITATFVVLLVSLLSFNAHAVVVSQQQLKIEQTIQEQGFGAQSVEEFLALTPKVVKEKTGKSLGLKGTLALKMAQKQVRKAIEHPGAPASGPKSQIVAVILAFFLGGIGIHRFYLGYTTIGIIQILTLGGCGIWALIDFIRILIGTLKPADGSNYDPTL